MSSGKRQSPINIRYADSVFDAKLDDTSWKFEYDPNDFIEINNNGYTWTVKCRDNTKSVLKASHLPADFKLVQFHAHWGSSSWNGAEHLLDNKGFASELHFVHYNTKYASFNEALEHDDGLAVVGVFLEEDPHNTDNKELQPLIDCLRHCKQKGQLATFVPNFDATTLLPKTKSFWTYMGSLTTPPYTECVIWNVMRESIPISFAQLKILRDLNPSNARAVQPLEGRKVRSSFELGGQSRD